MTIAVQIANIDLVDLDMIENSQDFVVVEQDSALWPHFLNIIPISVSIR